ncbi:MAG: TrbC/VirB2 family protein [Phenylobacterium sp.]|uniref:TrbC/VirB2 family protein n=1 Tax=Phenylobacterium sp. TaxID=1871053 RepID=UPI002734F6EE|nr:TrbC/VirB2 family protein [Phenylobacterium sp.]MDP3749293.1 TrbC/VirB2 family protein [Phenylobacterium sp.]
MNPLAVRRAGAVASIALVVALGAVQPALAQDVEGLLQNVVDMLTGNTARLLAVIAVVVVGILWMFGLFDLRRAAIVVLGIIVVFGAAEIVDMLTGGGTP